MKLGLGLYRQMLTPENFRFARQAGATHIVAHLTNYFAESEKLPSADSQGGNYGRSLGEAPWSYEQLRDLKAAINAEGLELAAIENFDPAHWYDVLLDGPRRAEQMEALKGIIRNMGRAGIPVMGYYFSLAGVYGWSKGAWARGGAVAVGYVEAMAPQPTPIPAGQVWNMTYNPSASGEPVPLTPEAVMWERLAAFLEELVPVAEEVGVRLAAHPDDPPLPELRGTGRLIYRPERYQRLLDLVPSRANALEFCVGAISEMVSDQMDIYQAVDQYSQQGKIAYVHLRNVRGKVPNYHEVFVDEGDTDMAQVLRILHQNGFEGVVIPDHVPEMECPAP
ncbi:MAG: TIM barrel protein, partial [Anaerolineae bacterium]|nr:TIM barrel protein [Anaerolineae bacterium]